jgi:hypothetical protein
MSTGKRRGRPATGTGKPLMIRCQDDFLGALDQWRRAQPDLPSRSEAVRRLVTLGLRVGAEATTEEK